MTEQSYLASTMIEEDEDENIKSNTTSSLHISNTISKPNVESILQAVATIFHSQMQEDQSMGKKFDEDNDLFYFSEEKYIKEKPEEFDEKRIELLREPPSIETIFEFTKALYDCAQFSPECCIICLIYINRLIAITGLSLHPTNWRPLVLCSLLVAQKVWDDRYLSNADFAFIYPFFTTEEINKLEQRFLELIQYNVSVKSALYAKYYFELRALFKDNKKEFPIQALSQAEARKLEIRTSKYQKAFSKVDGDKKKLGSTIGSVGSLYEQEKAKGSKAIIN